MFKGAETFGGHNHGATVRPISTLGSLTPVQEVNGVYKVTYKASIYASKSQIRVTATDPNSQCMGEFVSNPFIARVNTLVQFSTTSGGNTLVGGTCSHHGPSDATPAIAVACETPNNNHYLIQTSLDKLVKLQKAWTKTYVNDPKKLGSLRINDASLPKGGKFEAATWSEWILNFNLSGHKTHSRGLDVDIGLRDTNGKDTVTKKRLNALNVSSPVKLFSEVKDEANHMHVYFE